MELIYLGEHIVCAALLRIQLIRYGASWLSLILFSAMLFALPIPLFAGYSGLNYKLSITQC
ncbi:hypothetical protein ASJ81_03825 [Methanosarcina spelaei]|uniref:Uncharacterized protein n=1 Tax=Methanosarcina spelaei TaxID=1036679 RepID=A0A2A2HVT6_9EURY|nr:hypothetical protein ASJ81_03825 [Methanosarcina spelaei]